VYEYQTDSTVGDAWAQRHVRLLGDLGRLLPVLHANRDGLDAVPGRNHETRHVHGRRPRDELDCGRILAERGAGREPVHGLFRIDGGDADHRLVEHARTDLDGPCPLTGRVRPVQRILGCSNDAVLLARRVTRRADGGPPGCPRLGRRRPHGLCCVAVRIGCVRLGPHPGPR